MDSSASLLNDTAQTVYSDTAQLPYINIAMRELQEAFEQSNVPTTNAESVTITIPAGVSRITALTNPALPSDLIEIQQIWESATGTLNWTPMTRKETIPKYLLNTVNISQFIIWAWNKDGIEVVPANQSNDIKLDYIRSIFNLPILIGDVNFDLGVRNCDSFLLFRTAALCAQFIMENKTRADELNKDAIMALDRTLGINTKARQSIATRRKPFRSSYRNRDI